MKRINRALHVYQMAESKFVIFYTLYDFLVFYTIFSTLSRKYGKTVLGLALMCNHIHVLIADKDRNETKAFVSAYTARFAREYNADSGCNGPLFHARFGAAVKYGEKNIRTAAGYLYNNHVNKKLCVRAEGTRWNFLAYAHSDHPFSEQLVIRRASYRLKQSLKMVKALRENDDFLTYNCLRKLYCNLSKSEKEQLTDYIISTYKAVDYEALEQYYRSYEEMLYSFNANSFNEYELNEEATERSGDDRVYMKLTQLALANGKFKQVKDVLHLTENEKIRFAYELKQRTGINYEQIGAFLHIKLSFGRERVDEKYVREADALIEEGKEYLKSIRSQS